MSINPHTKQVLNYAKHKNVSSFGVGVKKAHKIFTTFSAKETQDLAEKNNIFLSVSSQQTQKFAQSLAERILQQGPQSQATFLALQGNLGSGKTTFMQGFGQGLGVKQRIQSPTFVILKIFRLPEEGKAKQGFKNLFHFDCYRIENPEEILSLGWKEIIANPLNIVAVEWPKKIKDFLPKNLIQLHFGFINSNQRKISKTIKAVV